MLEASRRPLTEAQRRTAQPIDLFTGQLIARWLAQHDHGPPASALLAVRAARRAVQASPDDAIAYLLLGQAYLCLMRDTVELTSLATAPTVAAVRAAQVAGALNQALRLQPGLLAAHAALAAFYQEAGQLDLARQHLRAQLAILRAIVPRPDAAEAFAQRVTRLEENERQLTDVVNDRTLLVQARSFQQDAVQQAQFARDQGLPALALETLRRADRATLGRAGTFLKVQLALLAGQAHEVRDEFAALAAAADGADADAAVAPDLAWLRHSARRRKALIGRRTPTWRR